MPRLRLKNNFIFYNENNEIINNHVAERFEQIFAERYIKENDIVIELGARYGTVSCAINSKLKNKKNQVSVEPDNTVWDALEFNKTNNNCDFHILKGVISNKKLNIKYNGYGTSTHRNENKHGDSEILNYTLKNIKEKYNLNFNVLVSDCEGYLETFLNENPNLYEELDMIIFEEDRQDICNYYLIKKNLKLNGFKRIAYKGYVTPQNVYSKSVRKADIY
jgi:hypothetical protein